jgi:hypothetical protein
MTKSQALYGKGRFDGRMQVLALMLIIMVSVWAFLKYKNRNNNLTQTI